MLGQKGSKEFIFCKYSMTVDLDLLDALVKQIQTSFCKFTLHLNEKNYSIENVSIIKSPTPVNSPTTRGGAYFSDKYAYKLKGVLHDQHILPFLTDTMLGPNTEFRKIRITTTINFQEKKHFVVLYTNLTNSIQSQSKIEINTNLISLEVAS